MATIKENMYVDICMLHAVLIVYVFLGSRRVTELRRTNLRSCQSYHSCNCSTGEICISRTKRTGGKWQGKPLIDVVCSCQVEDRRRLCLQGTILDKALVVSIREAMNAYFATIITTITHAGVYVSLILFCCLKF